MGPQDLVHFRVGNSGACGLASCRLERDCELWHVPGTKLDFIVKRSKGEAHSIGRAYTYVEEGGSLPSLHNWVGITLDMGQSVALAHCADGGDLLDGQ